MNVAKGLNLFRCISPVCVLILTAILPFDAMGFGKSAPSASAGKSIWLGRPDGSRSCEPESGLTREKVIASFKEVGIRIQALARGSDGKMRAQMCGMPTGRWVGVRIAEADRVNAEATGWRTWPEGMALEQVEEMDGTR